jgi:hypothetical protein
MRADVIPEVILLKRIAQDEEEAFGNYLRTLQKPLLEGGVKDGLVLRTGKGNYTLINDFFEI